MSAAAAPALPWLRPDLPAPSRFTVDERPHAAKLDQNEAAVDLPAGLKRAIGDALADAPWNRYPQPGAYRMAKTALATALGLDPDRVALTVGGDQAILAAFWLAGGAGRRARWFEPAYPYIPLAARVTGTAADAVPLGPELEARLDHDPALVDAGARADLLVLVAPGNPTGGSPSRAVIDAALADRSRLLLVDEAYADFAGETLLGESARHDNLLVARSLSKSLLAGVRLGFLVGHPDAVAAVERAFTAPYHLNQLQLAVAARMAEILPHVHAAVAAVRVERERVFAALAALPGIAARRSRANFVCFGVPGGAGAASRLAARLAGEGIRVRDVSGLPAAGESLRVTVGKPAENELFLRRLGEALAAG